MHVCVRLNTRSAERFEWEQMFCLRSIKREEREQKSFLEMHEQLCHISSYGTFLSKCFTSFVRTRCQSSLHWPNSEGEEEKYRVQFEKIVSGLLSAQFGLFQRHLLFLFPKTQWLFFALNLWAANTRKDPIEFHIANAPGATELHDWLAIVTNNVWKGREKYFYRIKWGPASQMAACMRKKNQIIKLITSSDIASWAWLKC